MILESLKVERSHGLPNARLCLCHGFLQYLQNVSCVPLRVWPSAWAHRRSACSAAFPSFLETSRWCVACALDILWMCLILASRMAPFRGEAQQESIYCLFLTSSRRQAPAIRAFVASQNQNSHGPHLRKYPALLRITAKTLAESNSVWKRLTEFCPNGLPEWWAASWWSKRVWTSNLLDKVYIEANMVQTWTDYKSCYDLLRQIPLKCFCF